RAAVSRSVIVRRPLAGSVRAISHATRQSASQDRAAGRVVNGPERERHEPDYVLMAVATALAAIGILMVYSSTGHNAAAYRGNVYHDVAEQLMWGLIGGAVLLVMMRTDYRYWRSFSILGIVVAMVLLVLVIGPKIPPLLYPIEANGATRWLQIGGLPSFQPTEVAKLALVIFLAHWLSARGKKVGSFRAGLLPFLFVVGPMAALILLEPDLGTTGVVVLTAFAMLFVAGGSILQMLMLVPVGLAGVAAVIMQRDYMQARLEIYQNPLSDPTGPGHQTFRSIHSLAHGGLTGTGLGQSQRPSPEGLTVPAAENDFIFAVIGQEFGYVGAVAVIGLFLLLAFRGIRVAMRAPDTFGGLLALGITAWLTFQALINIGVVVNLIPMTGMPLPFLSKGGTSLVVVLAAVGILLSISRETVTRGADAHEDPHRGRGHRRPHLPSPGRRDPAADPTA
ncbi:MAG: putative peptidoglycan glycosyltransferase FtsW, partial [Chloroflexota bacterium]